MKPTVFTVGQGGGRMIIFIVFSRRGMAVGILVCMLNNVRTRNPNPVSQLVQWALLRRDALRRQRSRN